jgi:Prokaryotic E2 family E
VSAQPQINDAISTAIAELRGEYEEVSWIPDGAGGAYVAVTPLEFGERWAPAAATVEFGLVFNYPYAPVYPFYTTSTLERGDGGQWPNALQRVNWRGMEYTQISLRTRRWEPAHDTVSTALRFVERWFQTTE